MKTLHIIGNYVASIHLQTLFSKEFSNQQIIHENSVLCFPDSLSEGKLFTSLARSELQQRQDFWASLHYQYDNYADEIIEFFNFNFQQFGQIVIWHSDVASDRLMLYLLCDYFEKINLHNIFEIYGTKTLNPKTSLYEWFSFGLCDEQELQSFIKYEKPISKTQLHENSLKWQTWQDSQSNLRILKSNEVMSVSENYYDKWLLADCSSEFRKCAYVIAYALTEADNLIGDGFLHYRIHELIKKGKLISDSDNIEDMREYSIKLAIN